MDKEVFDIITKEKERQINGLELIASENYVSQDVLSAMGSILTNKYAEGYPHHRFYGGCEFVDEIEELAIQRAKELFNVEYVNVQPHSGSQANAATLSAFLNPGDRILSLDLQFGGHLTHGSPASFSGKLYKIFHYGVDRDTETINMHEVEKIAEEVKPNLIICGASAYSQDFDYKAFRDIADKHDAILMCDMAHTAGIIACKKFLNDPFEYCHVVTTTTHKTLRGPRGGMILMKKDFRNKKGIKNKLGEIKKMSKIINSSVFPGQQGGPLMHIIAGKAVCFYEALQNDFTIYIEQVLKNAKYLAKLFQDNGFKIISGGTKNHLMLVDLSNKNITGKEAEEILYKAGITVNKNMIPFDEQKPNITSGIRLGTPAITTRGFKEKEIEKVFEFINEALKNKDNDSFLEKIKKEIQKTFNKYPIFSK